MVSAMGRRSIPFFILWSRGVRKVKDLTQNSLYDLRRYIAQDKAVTITKAVCTNLAGAQSELELKFYYSGKCFKPLIKFTSKEIRTTRSLNKPLQIFKIGMDLSVSETLSWGLQVSKLTSTRHKNTLLRVAHGDIYTRERLFRFGMTPDPSCPRCGMLETLQHRYIECDYVKRIWRLAKVASQAVTSGNPANELDTQAALGAYLDSNLAILTFNAELLDRINILKEDNYLLLPKVIVKNALNSLIKREKKQQLKTSLKSILEKLALS